MSERLGVLAPKGHGSHASDPFLTLGTPAQILLTPFSLYPATGCFPWAPAPPGHAYVGHYRFLLQDVGVSKGQPATPDGETLRLDCTYAFLGAAPPLQGCVGPATAYPNRWHTMTVLVNANAVLPLGAQVPSEGRIELAFLQ